MPLFVVILLLAGQLLIAPAGFAQDASEALARRLLNSQGCKACHSFEGTGATRGSDLDKVGSRLTREQLRSQLVNPQHRHADGRIADFSHLQEHEIEALTNFLSERR
jgi:cbb3-type cytochrome oxidase cytochrome c subunit